MNSPGSTTPPPLPYYRPIFTVMLTIEYQIFGLWPQGWHLISLLLHILASVGVFYVILLWSRRRLIALFAAALFAVHPVHAESVSWISGMTDPLFSIFFLASFYFYLRSRRASEPGDRRDKSASISNSRRALALSVVSFVIALFKGDGVESGAARIRLRVDRDPGQVNNASSPRARQALPYAAASMLYLIPRYLVLGESMWVNPQAPERPFIYDLDVAFCRGQLSLSPLLAGWLELSATRFITSASSPMFLLPSLMILACAIGLFAYRNRINREVWLGLLLIFVPLMPVLRLGQVSRRVSGLRPLSLSFRSRFCLSSGDWLCETGGFESRAPANSRRAMPSLFTMAGLLLTTVESPQSRIALVGLIRAVVSRSSRACRPTGRHTTTLALRFLTWVVSPRLAAIARAAALKPDEAIVFDALGRACEGAGDWSEAERSFKRALELDPLLFESLNNLGRSYFKRNDYVC
jgi:hypothetical protein